MRPSTALTVTNHVVVLTAGRVLAAGVRLTSGVPFGAASDGVPGAARGPFRRCSRGIAAAVLSEPAPPERPELPGISERAGSMLMRDCESSAVNTLGAA